MWMEKEEMTNQLCRSTTNQFGVFYSCNLEKGHEGNHKFTMEWN